MGSIGLAGSPEPMIQSAVGGNRADNAYIELVVRGATARVSPILRTAADMSGGFIASCRNPVRAGYVRRHAALGGISLALSLGHAILDAEPRGGSAVIDAIVDHTGGAILGRGRVTEKNVRYTSEAFDIGTIAVDAGGRRLILHVMNEYMAVDDVAVDDVAVDDVAADRGAGQRLATYPDVVTTLGADGTPLSVGEIETGTQVAVLHVPKTCIPLSSSVRDPSVYPVVERALGIEIARYALG